MIAKRCCKQIPAYLYTRIFSTEIKAIYIQEDLERDMTRLYLYKRVGIYFVYIRSFPDIACSNGLLIKQSKPLVRRFCLGVPHSLMECQ